MAHVAKMIQPNTVPAKMVPKSMSHHRHWLCAALIAGLCALTGSASAATPQTGGWRLLSKPDPVGGGGMASMSHTADMTRSDLDLVGLMLRCRAKGAQGAALPTGDADQTGAEIAIVVITPFPPLAQPQVTVGAAGKEWRFDARIVPPGAELLLPAPASDLAAGPWQSANALTIKVSWQDRSFSGVIPIDGLAEALATLAANCPAD